MDEVPKAEGGQEEAQEKDLHTRVLEIIEKAKVQDDEWRKIKGDRFDEELEARIDSEGFVIFGEISHGLLGKQSQYGSRYLNKNFSEDYPYFGDGIKIKGNPDDYHALRVHRDDIEKFVERYEEYRKSLGEL